MREHGSVRAADLVIRMPDGSRLEFKRAAEVKKFDPRQLRDRNGRWTTTPGYRAGYGDEIQTFDAIEDDARKAGKKPKAPRPAPRS